MTYIEENWCFNDHKDVLGNKDLNPKEFPNIIYGDSFIGCNLSRSEPMTKLFEGVDGLIFEGCNLNNVDVWHNKTWIINWETCSYFQNEYDFTPEQPRGLPGL